MKIVFTASLMIMILQRVGCVEESDLAIKVPDGTPVVILYPVADDDFTAKTHLMAYSFISTTVIKSVFIHSLLRSYG